MARKKQHIKKYRCCFGDHKEIVIGGITVDDGFKLTAGLKKNESFMAAFNRALELKTICPL